MAEFSRESKALRENYADFISGVNPESVIPALYCELLLTIEEKERATQKTLTAREQQDEVFKCLERRVSVDPSVFHKLIEVLLLQEPAVNAVGKKMKACYEKEQVIAVNETEERQGGSSLTDECAIRKGRLEEITREEENINKNQVITTKGLTVKDRTEGGERDQGCFPCCKRYRPRQSQEDVVEILGLAEACREKDEVLAAKHQEIAAKETALSDERLRVSSLTDKCTTLELDLEQLTEEKSRLENVCREKDEILTAKEQEIAIKQKALSEERQGVSSLTDECATLKERLEEMSKANDYLQAHLKALKEESIYTSMQRRIQSLKATFQPSNHKPGKPLKEMEAGRSVVHEGYIYFAPYSSNEIHRYSVLSDMWSTLGETMQYCNPGLGIIDGCVAAIGGRKENKPTNEVRVWKDQTWAPCTSMKYKRSDPAVVTSSDYNYVIVISGNEQNDVY